jgi:cob(I)alamin adenosyltransferase
VESAVNGDYYITMLKKGLVQIYTGDGKGKTTAAFGLALRAAGQGHKVLIFQFLKPTSLDIGERKALSSFPSITIETLDADWDMAKSRLRQKAPRFILGVKKAIHDSLEMLSDLAAQRQYDVIILDEIVYCLSKGLAALEDIKDLIEKRDKHVELILTGRGAKQELLELADLVSEIRSIKHPFEKGISARRGIEF